MKKLVSSLAIAGMFTFGFSTVSFADQQDPVNQNEEGVELQEEGMEGQEDSSAMEAISAEPISADMGQDEPVEVEEAEEEKKLDLPLRLKRSLLKEIHFGWVSF